MIPYRVSIGRRAERELDHADAWWRAHRQAAPTLLLDELREALDFLTTAPLVGQACRPGVRRLLLPQTRYHVFYTVDDQACVINIRALWHATRGQGPRLR